MGTDSASSATAACGLGVPSFRTVSAARLGPTASWILHASAAAVSTDRTGERVRRRVIQGERGRSDTMPSGRFEVKDGVRRVLVWTWRRWLKSKSRSDLSPSMSCYVRTPLLQCCLRLSESTVPHAGQQGDRRQPLAGRSCCRAPVDDHQISPSPAPLTNLLVAARAGWYLRIRTHLAPRATLMRRPDGGDSPGFG